MPSSASIVSVCYGPHPHLDGVFDGLCRALTAARIPCRTFAGQSALLEDRDALAASTVIAAFGGLPVTARELDAAPGLAGVVSCVSGTDGIDLAAASARGVLVCNAPTQENARGMAEACMLLMLHLAYDLDGTRADLDHGFRRPSPVRARMLQGKTIGLVGWGRIAKELAALLAGWHVRLVVHSRRGRPADLPAHVEALPLGALLAASDAVCVLAGVERGAPPIMGAADLARMKPTAHLVNVARGAAIDEAALVEALRERRIAGAALDVFASEPLAADSPLRALPNVILTPHHVGHTIEGDASLVPALVANVFALLRGETPPYVRNPDALPAWRARRAAA